MEAIQSSLLKLEEKRIDYQEILKESAPNEDDVKDEEIDETEAADKSSLESEGIPENAEKILDFIMAPREIEKDDGKYVVMVSRELATREDVLNLEKLLTEYQEKRKARLVGLCPVRRELYEQCFDELIRQSTLRSAERGALLLRVRDELRMSIAAYESLYESGVAYGLRKFSEAESREKQVEQRVQQLEAEIREAKQRTKELKSAIEQAVKVSAEQKAINEKRHHEKMEYLKKSNEQLKDQLDMMMKK